jgi:Putative prokaryotic signal transducing protein
VCSLDPEEEQRRLAKLYAQMADTELEAIAADLSGLTDAAQQALQNEIGRRGGLKTEAAEVLSVRQRDAVELPDLVSIRQLRDVHEALLAKGVLDSAGIECFLLDDNMVRMDWFISNLLGGIKLCVKREDAEAALDLLEQPIPDEFDVEGVGQYEQPRCPKCQSLDITFEELNQSVAYVSAYVFVPIPLHRKGWVCHSCGQEWQEHEEKGS